jgi:predicted nucleic acid-binding protein
MVVLATHVLSELRRRKPTHPKVAAWADSVQASDLYLSAITILEIEAGALMLARQDAAQGAVLRAWIDDKVLPAFAGRILAIDTAVAYRCARLHLPDPRAERDALIAATALVHRMCVVTRNVSGIQPMGAELLNPWG